MASHKSVVLGSGAPAGGSGPSASQLPSSLGQDTMANSLPVVIASDQTDIAIIQGTPVKTTNTTYITAGDMSADVAGPSITVGPEGRVLLDCAWSNTGAPIGTLVLQGQLLDGSSWDDIPFSFTAFKTHPNNDTNTALAIFSDLQIFTAVRFFYRRTSGGTANTSLVVKTRIM